ncbi:MAG: type II toxin-antitoxin system ParD family antitoxin [Bacteroidota bacterium]
MNVSLTPELERFTRALVKSGRYNSASEVVRTGLRLLEEQEGKTEALRGLLQEALDSGRPVRFTREALKEKARQRMAELRAEVERGERPPPGGPDSIVV